MVFHFWFRYSCKDLIGNNIIFWGKNEFFNPVDVINSQDYSKGLNKGEKIEEIINYFLHKILSVWLDKTLSGSLSQLLKNEGSSVVPSLNANFDETTADNSISAQEGKKDSEIIRLTNIVKNDFV